MRSLIKQLNQKFIIAIEKYYSLGLDLPENLVFPASNPQFGDYQCNIALSLAKKVGDNPRNIAQKIIDNLEIDEFCLPSEIAGAGFINLTLKKEYLENSLEQLLKTPLAQAIDKVDIPQKIIVDFSSPNIAKEMHVGHLRSTIIGDCLARIFEFRGHDVLRLNHVGDWGTQFGMLIAYLTEAYPDALTKADALDLGDLVNFYKKAKERFDQDEPFKEIARLEVVKLQSGNSNSLKAWNLLCQQSRQEFQKIYNILDISLRERGESFYNPYLGHIIELLRSQQLLEENQGAQCVFLEGFSNKDGQPLPLIVQKSDGGYNYATTDLSALEYRVLKDGADKIIYVTDAGQCDHFAQVFQVAKRAKILSQKVEAIHVPFGLVQGEDGKKLKTRSGETVKLKDLLTEAVKRARDDLQTRLLEENRTETQDFIDEVAQKVGIGAVKYADLSQNRISNYIFSFDKMLALQGNTAPYMLYAYARIQGINRENQVNQQFIATSSPKIILEDDTEVILAKALLELPEVLEQVERELQPNRLCEYLYELSRKFNKFYENCPVLKSNEPLRSSRLGLCYLTANTLQLGLSLLGIKTLERM